MEEHHDKKISDWTGKNIENGQGCTRDDRRGGNDPRRQKRGIRLKRRIGLKNMGNVAQR